MNIYFFPTERTEVTLPGNNLSPIITDSILTIDEVKKKNPDIDDILNERDGELIQLYKNYKSKKFEKTTAQKKLNKIKVYVIVKSKIVKGKPVTFAVPIRNYDDLGNSVIEKSKGFIASIFYVRLNDGKAKLPSADTGNDPKNEGRAVSRAASRALNRPFLLDHLMATQVPFGAEDEITLKNFKLPKDYDVEGNKIPDKPFVLSKEGYIDEDYAEEYLEKMRKYDYTYSMLDNTGIVNVSKYVTDIREKKTFDGEEEPDLLNRIKGINFKKDVLKLLNISNFVSFLFRDKSSLMDKNIIPIFSNLEDAQDLLITVLEEVNHPFRARRQIETSSTPRYYRSLDYLDDSFTFQNRYFLPDPTDRGDVITDFLRRYRLIKPRNRISTIDYYNEDNYQTKGPFYVEDIDTDSGDEYIPMSQRPRSAPKCIWRESDYWAFMRRYFPDQPEAYSWWETRDMSKADKGLLQKSQDVKIISMGLSDFLEFWNNHQQKNAEVLFIPSSDYLKKKKLPLLPKKTRDRFYDYQQKYRGSKKHDTNNYSYEITISS